MMKNILYSLLLFLPLLARGQIIITVAGTGADGYNGDGFAATAAKLNLPWALTLDKQGNIYFNDGSNERLRKISPAYGGVISTVAGNGTADPTVGGLPTIYTGVFALDIAIHPKGNIFFVDNSDSKIWRISTDGIINLYAGTGVAGYNGDGIVATAAQLNRPTGVTVDDTGNVYVADQRNFRIRKIDTFGIITTIAGTRIAGYSPDGSRADTASLFDMLNIRAGYDNRVYFTDNLCIRRLNADGTIVTIAGNGTSGYSGDGGPATGAKIAPAALWIDSFNNVYFAEAHNRIRKIDADGIINTIAGTGGAGDSGDWGDPLLAMVNGPGVSL